MLPSYADNTDNYDRSASAVITGKHRKSGSSALSPGSRCMKVVHEESV